jgi:hypothetical protein
VRNIVVIGEDESLLRTRAAVLSTMGAQTVQCSPADLARFTGAEGFSLAVLCHSIPGERRESVSEQVKQLWPGIKVLQVRTLAHDGLSAVTHADATAVAGRPKDLLARASQLLASET